MIAASPTTQRSRHQSKSGCIAPSLTREQRTRAITLSAGLTPELPLRQALDEVTRLAQPLLPAGSRLIPLAEAATLAGLADFIVPHQAIWQEEDMAGSVLRFAQAVR